MNLVASLSVVYAMTMAATRDMCRRAGCAPTRPTEASVPADVVGSDLLPVVNGVATAVDPQAGMVSLRLDAPARRWGR